MTAAIVKVVIVGRNKDCPECNSTFNQVEVVVKNCEDYEEIKAIAERAAIAWAKDQPHLQGPFTTVVNPTYAQETPRIFAMGNL